MLATYDFEYPFYNLIFQRMGNSQKKTEDYKIINSFQRDQWINKEALPHCQIWENINSHLHCQAYEIPSNIDIEELDNYELRQKHDQDIVKVHHIAVDKNKNLCSKSDKAHALVQRIPYRLENVQDLSQSEALTVLRSSYRGYNTIGSFQGPIEPYEDMVCFNQLGKPKVWLNSNLGKNKPEPARQQNPVKSPMNRNEVYVRKIFNMVESRTLSRELPAQLKNSFRQNNPNNFFEALNLVEQYAQNRNIEIPQTITPRNYLSEAKVQNKILSSQVKSVAEVMKTEPNLPINQSSSIIQLNRAPNLPPSSHIYQQKSTSHQNIHQPFPQNSIPVRQIHHPTPVKNVQSPAFIPNRQTQINITPTKQNQIVAPVSIPRNNSPNQFTLAAPPSSKIIQNFAPQNLNPNQNLQFQQQPIVTRNIIRSPPKQIIQQNIGLQQSKRSHNIPQPMIFSFNNNSLQSNLVETAQSQQINVPRYSVVESQQANSPLINESPFRQEQNRQVQINAPTRFDSPNKILINQPIIHQVVSSEEHKRESDEKQERQEFEKGRDEEVEQRLGFEDHYEETNVVRNRQVQSQEDENDFGAQFERRRLKQLECNEDIERQINVNKKQIDLREGESLQNSRENQGQNLYYKKEKSQDSEKHQETQIVKPNQHIIQQRYVEYQKQNQTVQYHHQHQEDQQTKREEINIMNSFKQNKVQQSSPQIQEQQQKKSQPQVPEEQPYNYKYRESEVQQFQFNQKNYPQNIQGKQIQSNYSPKNQHFLKDLGIQKTVSIQTPVVAHHRQEDRIPEDASYENIQEYIKNKFKNYIHQSNQQKPQQYKDVKHMASYVESKYNKIKMIQHNEEQEIRPELPTFTPMEKNIDFEDEIYNQQNSNSEKQLDVLDVKMMEKSLDKKYNSIRMQKPQENKAQEQDIDVRQLQQNLIRFEESRVGNKFAVSQVSKIGSLDQRINLNMKQNYETKPYETKLYQKKTYLPKSYKSKTYESKTYEPKPYEYKSYELKSNVDSSSNYNKNNASSKYSSNKKIQNYMSSIDEKYNKYVLKGSAVESVQGSKANKFISKGSIEEYPNTGKSSHYQYQDYTQWNRENQQNYDNSSRLATGKFNYTSNEDKSSSRNNYDTKGGITYDSLRKFLWS